MFSEIYEIPIDFCPKCRNKKIRVVMGMSYENEYSLSGKCLKRGKSGYVTYMLLSCPKCGWTSHSWNECGYEDEQEYNELQRIYLEENR